MATSVGLLGLQMAVPNYSPALNMGAYISQTSFSASNGIIFVCLSKVLAEVYHQMNISQGASADVQLYINQIETALSLLATGITVYENHSFLMASTLVDMAVNTVKLGTSFYYEL